jgi:hypothetical protein
MAAARPRQHSERSALLAAATRRPYPLNQTGQARVTAIKGLRQDL